ncbi:MAG: response regulator transcription factor [Chloroflexi bacterium]|nr:response regulator transcription factor [Chloroflexota bacterium]
MTKSIRVLLVDDHAVVRSGLRLLIEQEPDIVVIGEAEDGAHAVQLACALQPDVTVMDITLPDFDGIEATRRIRAALPDARVLALTMHDEEAHLVPFLEAGGTGYVRKSAADRDVVTAIRTVARGESFLQPEGVQAIVREHRDTRPGLDVLSERERQVLTLTARGYTSREIGDQLALSPRTVETYRERIMQKLGLQHRSELVEFALTHNLLADSSP